MKYGKLIFLGFIGCLLLSSCNKWTQFDIPYNKEVTIPAAVPVGLNYTYSVPVTADEMGTDYAAHKDDIQSVKLTEASITATMPAGATLSFLDNIHIYIKADGLDEKELAYKVNVPASIGNSLMLDVSPIELNEYLRKDGYTLRVSALKDEVVTQDITLKIHASFLVDLKILGI